MHWWTCYLFVVWSYSKCVYSESEVMLFVLCCVVCVCSLWAAWLVGLWVVVAFWLLHHQLNICFRKRQTEFECQLGCQLTLFFY